MTWRDPWVLSGASHFFIIFSIMWVVLYEPSYEYTEFEVINAPVAATQQLTPINRPKVAPQKKVIKKKRAVFGQTSKALTAPKSGQELNFKKGNTVAKEIDNKVLKKGDAESLPIPVEEYLVSRMPVLMSEVKVPYPPKAKEAGIQGPVVMDLLIGPKGRVRQVSFVEGPGFGLNEAALAAAKRFLFKPAVVEEKTVAVRIRFAYRFVLE